MAQRRGRATSRCAGGTQTQWRRKRATSAICLWICLLFPSAAEAGLYSPSDQIILLNAESVKSVLINSTAAIVAEFYASWCGHCVAFSPVYKTLARDIKGPEPISWKRTAATTSCAFSCDGISHQADFSQVVEPPKALLKSGVEWKPAVDLAAVDCAAAETRQICRDYGVKGYPTIKFFHAYSKDGSRGLSLIDFPRDVRRLRHRIIDQLEKHPEQWPPACPPLEPISQAEIDSFFQTNNVKHLALIFEDERSYTGREVTLDLLQFENIAVRRVLSSQEGLVTKLGVTGFPSCYLYYPGGNFTRLQVNIEARIFYSYALLRLPGVVRSGKPAPDAIENATNKTNEPWRPFNRSRVYMADLESTLDYSLRVELASSTVFRDDVLVSLKKYISVLVKYFPGRPVVMNLLRSLNSWLQDQSGSEISYVALKKILDNTAQTPNAALPEGARWVACQGSHPFLRRYPCGVWTLFHLLTVQAKTAGDADPQEVLSTMRGYVRHFFGCRPCAEHFEEMAKESLSELNTLSTAALWLWSRHNRVNNRLAGDLSEDPNFPKIQWPSPEMCPACHSVKENGEHRWNQDQVLAFLLSYYSASNILTDYLEDENQILAKQRERHASRAVEARNRAERRAREALDSIALPSQAPVQSEEEEEEEEVQDEEAEGGEGATAGEMAGKASDPTAWAKREMAGEGRPQVRRRPSIVGMRMKEKREEIVDLDSFVNQHYKAKALQLAAASRIKQRTLQRKVEPEPGPVFGLGLELDAGFGMVGLQPLDEGAELDSPQQREPRQKRELVGHYFSGEAEWGRRRQWMSALSIGFSRVDVSLCVILYFLSSLCLLAMYLFFKSRLKLRRAKIALS